MTEGWKRKEVFALSSKTNQRGYPDGWKPCLHYGAGGAASTLCAWFRMGRIIGMEERTSGVFKRGQISWG